MAFTPIPPRSSNAITGSQFATEIRRENTSKATREGRVLQELLGGNIPTFFRNLVDVVVGATIKGKPHTVSYRVFPDYLAIGSDDDYLRMPMSPLTAQVFGDEHGFSLPTSLMVNQIHDAADVKLEPVPIQPNSESFDLFVAHNETIQSQLAQVQAVPGALVGGIKKDVVVSAQMHTHPGKVVLYGWHRIKGGVVQPLFPSAPPATAGHAVDYMDYSHGIRLVESSVVVDNQSMTLAALLAHPVLCRLVSNEGPLAKIRYEGTAVVPVQAPERIDVADGDSPEEEEAAPQTVEEHHLLACQYTRWQVDRGVSMHGQGTWETWGDDRGPLVNEYLQRVGIEPGNQWCGCFVGTSFLDAGFDGETRIPADWTPAGRPEPKRIVFLSAYRLRLFFEKANCPRLEFPRSGLSSRDTCAAWLDEYLATFAPVPGDVLLAHTHADYSHVAMVASYDPTTYELLTYEGNMNGNAGLFRWDLSAPTVLGFYRINMLGRFRPEDFTGTRNG